MKRIFDIILLLFEDSFETGRNKSVDSSCSSSGRDIIHNHETFLVAICINRLGSGVKRAVVIPKRVWDGAG